MNEFVLVRLSMITGILSVMIGLLSGNMPNIIIGLLLLWFAVGFQMRLIERDQL